uniref:mitogen-activated protein kinase kinase n=1 Tax=Acrobeloides nanus TaxID=290746 RepID=A0A914EI72_9BILA
MSKKINRNMDNSPAASCTPPPELPDIAEANKLVFPGVYDYDSNAEHGKDVKKPNPKIYDYDPNHFIYIDIIESGRHIVKEYQYHNVPLLVKMAVKTIRIPKNRYDRERDDKIKRLTQEITTFRTLSHHPSIVNFYGLCFNNDEAMICMELMKMSLYDLYLTVHYKNGVFSEKILGYIAIQILEALGFYSLASTFVGTIAYWPPERFSSNTEINEGNFKKFDVRSDIWSFGITLAETAYGSLPFLDENGEPIMRDNRQENIVTIQRCIINANSEELIQRCFGETYSKDFVDFVNSCLEKLEKRPKYDKLRETEFYSRFIQKENVKQEDMANFIKQFEE